MSQITEILKTLDPLEQERLAAELEGELEQLPLQRSDHHARAMYHRAVKSLTSFIPKTARDVGIPTTMGELDKLDVVPGFIAVAIVDEDNEVATGPVEAVMRALRSVPLFEDDRQWSSLDEAKKLIEEHLTSIQPPPFLEWPDVSSDVTLSLVAFQGFAAHLLEPAKGRAEDAAYVVDLAWMSGLPVRPGNEPLGACAYFAADRTLLRIYTGHDDTMHAPGDDLWEHAKWHWRCSVFAYVTVASHLGGLHFTCSELMLQATREELPADHALRRLLKPHVFGVSTINASAGLVLAPEGGVANRLWPFTFEGLATLLTRGVTHATFETFPATMAAKDIQDLGDSYPYATDGLALFAICEKYAQEYIDLYFPNETIAQDPDVRRWWQHLMNAAPQTGLSPLACRQQVVDLVGQFIFLVSGYHAQVGAIVQYAIDPTFMGGKVRAGSERADIQATIQLLTLTALTGFNQPKLLDDYTHVFLAQHHEEASGAFQRFQAALFQLGRDIDARNEQRDLPMRTFHPALLDSAVSK